MSSKDFIISFKENVSQAEVDRQIKDLEAAGGKIKKRWDRTFINGFAATIPVAYLTTFQTLQADKISSIEPDGIVSIQ